MRTERLRQEYRVKFRWTVFPLHPEVPAEGMELAELFPGREAEVSVMQERLLEISAAEGLPMGKRTRTYNSRGAQELEKWAETRGMGDQLRNGVYRAFFVEGVNIGQVEELVRIAEVAGLPVAEARSVLKDGTFSMAVDADWQRTRELGITAVPTHLYQGRKLAGFRPYEDFIRLLGKG